MLTDELTDDELRETFEAEGGVYALALVEDPDEEVATELSIGYGDVVAHLFEDAVTASVPMLAALPGVAGAHHEDREVVLVQLAGASPTAVQVALDAFWRERLGDVAPDVISTWDDADEDED
ncbi:RNA-binding protein [Angustibacter aerolatus]